MSSRRTGPYFWLDCEIREHGVVEVFVNAETSDKARINTKACVTELLISGELLGLYL